MKLRIEGYAIVSDDGMLADADGVMPAALRIEADQAFLSDGLDRADVILHGRHSHEGHAQSPRRRRLIATRGVDALSPAPDHPNAALWNPSTLPLERALEAMNMDGGTVAVLGGTELFGLFLPRYDVFHLSRAAGLRLPGGRPVFPRVPARSPESVLAAAGLGADPPRMLDATRGLSLVTWRRPAFV